MRRVLVNDCLTTIPGTRTFWSDLQDWFSMEFRGGDYSVLAQTDVSDASLVIRNATWFPPLAGNVPTISLLQDIIENGPQRQMQLDVIERGGVHVVFNSAFTAEQYSQIGGRVIPLPVDFDLFTPGDSAAAQQKLSLPDGCVCWVGASQDAAGQVKGWDTFISIVRANPDLPFVAVLKDGAPQLMPPNLRCFVRLTHEELVDVYRACRVGLCTSRQETQHLAGIEMGACGLPMVAPPVGCYYEREKMPGFVLAGASTDYTTVIRGILASGTDTEAVRSYWCTEFDKPVIRQKWEELISAVEHTDRRNS